MKFQFSLKKLQLEFKVPQLESKSKSKSENFGRKSWLALVVFMVVLSIGAWVFYYNQGLTLAYNDARSHLDVARRVVDSLQPGAAQIGSVWLPLPHILELPLIWNDTLWHTGIAGSAISMIAFVLGGIYLLKIAQKLKLDKWASLLSLGVYLFNPNLLFMQTTPLTEALLIFLSLATVYYLLDWVESFSVLSLVMAAFFTFLSTLARYDGWFVLMFVTVIVAVVAYMKRGYKFAEGNTFLYGTMASLGVVLWFVWNKLIFGNAFYFINGEFSAKAQQDLLSAAGQLLTKGNILYSTFVYLFAVGYNMGTWICIAAAAGIWIVFSTRQFRKEIKIALIALLAPLAFNILSLYSGNSVLYLPKLPPFTWFNDRYGLMMLPAAAIFVGILVNKKRLATILVSLLLILQCFSMYYGNNIITIQDGVRGASGEFLDLAGSWLHEHATTGLILAAASSNDALLFRSGFHLDRFIVEGARKYWDKSIEDPTVYATWIIMHKGDLVYKHLATNPLFLNNYHLAYHDDFSFIYQRNQGKHDPIAVTELP